ncbi:P-type phospholipid transporter [Mycena venus]|uniref:P-type phospholipid transporter n=1 Tax=Mycena venus TaxID=2733690 RepID=A0A8H6X859_9AGAR|nr:P-type phospholipid transporter [Mycena venus]
MSLKDELKLWHAARNAFDNGHYEESLKLFSRLPRSAMVSTNMGLLSAAMGDHEKALSWFTDATAKDPYLTIAYFQRGVSHFLLERYRPAGRDFKRAWLSLRGNEEINYEQLGLSFRLFASEVLFNLGLSRIRLGRLEKGMEYLEKAKCLTMIADHDVIEDVILQQGEGFTVFSIPPGVLSWPSGTKLMSIERKEFMGKAILIATSDPDDLTTGFSGLQLKQKHRQKNLHRQSNAVVAQRVTLVSIRPTSVAETDVPLPPRRSADDQRRAEEEMRLP